MLPAAYYHWGEDDFPATMDVQLLSSRDGISWQRQGERPGLFAPGLGRWPVERNAVCQSVVYPGGATSYGSITMARRGGTVAERTSSGRERAEFFALRCG